MIVPPWLLLLLLLWSVFLLIWWLRGGSLAQLLAQHQDLPSVNPKVNLGRVSSVHSIQGARSHMEDSYYADYAKGYFGVFDGHGGNRCSRYAAQHLHELIFKHNVVDHASSALIDGFQELDHSWLSLADANRWDDGSTGVAVLIVNRTLYVANVGDSRAVLCSGGKAIDMSHDHKPNRPDEKKRIEELGGRIIFYGTWRVEGVLAVTRAFGDRRLKKYVSALPEVKVRSLESSDEFLILATDGVWDVISSQQAVDIVAQATNSQDDKQQWDVKQAATKLTNAASAYRSMDNITSLVIDLKQYR